MLKYSVKLIDELTVSDLEPIFAGSVVGVEDVEARVSGMRTFAKQEAEAMMKPPHRAVFEAVQFHVEEWAQVLLGAVMRETDNMVAEKPGERWAGVSEQDRPLASRLLTQAMVRGGRSCTDYLCGVILAYTTYYTCRYVEQLAEAYGELERIHLEGNDGGAVLIVKTPLGTYRAQIVSDELAQRIALPMPVTGSTYMAYERGVYLGDPQL